MSIYYGIYGIPLKKIILFVLFSLLFLTAKIWTFFNLENTSFPFLSIYYGIYGIFPTEPLPARIVKSLKLNKKHMFPWKSSFYFLVFLLLKFEYIFLVFNFSLSWPTKSFFFWFLPGLIYFPIIAFFFSLQAITQSISEYP